MEKHCFEEISLVPFFVSMLAPEFLWLGLAVGIPVIIMGSAIGVALLSGRRPKCPKLSRCRGHFRCCSDPPSDPERGSAWADYVFDETWWDPASVHRNRAHFGGHHELQPMAARPAVFDRPPPVRGCQLQPEQLVFSPDAAHLHRVIYHAGDRN